MKHKTLSLLFILITLFTHKARSDLLGGDVAVLSQILVQTVNQLTELKKVVGTANEHVMMVRNIHEGINDSLLLLKDIESTLDPGLFKDWDSVSKALHNIESIYGAVENLKDRELYKNTDLSVAESIVFNNKLFKNADFTDAVGERIKDFSHSVSPGGAQKLTAQSLGVLIKVQNNALRAQAKNIKLQAQGLARLNKKDKDQASQISKTVLEIDNALTEQQSQRKFKIPRF